jgi:hypothetical protein
MSKATVVHDVNDSGLPPSKKMEEAQRVLTGSVPVIPETPNVIFELPRGALIGGSWENEVEVRELTGSDEEALAKFKSPEDFFNAVIVYGTARIGSKQLSDMTFPERNFVLSGLLIGERETLFLNIARATYGDEKTINHQCRFCGLDIETVVVLSEDISCKEMSSPHTITYSLTTSKGTVLTYRLATGADQTLVLSRKGASSAEQNTMMIAECLISVNGENVFDGASSARSLSMGDRTALLQKLSEEQPSPNLDIPLSCVGCGAEIGVPLSWGDIFRP